MARSRRNWDYFTASAPQNLPVNEPQVRTESLIKSAKFGKYQQDFVRALLPNKSYTVSEATRILQNYFNERR